VFEGRLRRRRNSRSGSGTGVRHVSVGAHQKQFMLLRTCRSTSYLRQTHCTVLCGQTPLTELRFVKEWWKLLLRLDPLGLNGRGWGEIIQMNGSFVLSGEKRIVCETDGFRCVGKGINTEERAAYRKPCMPSYGKDVISLV
jgi:hypothetical protein